VSGKLDFGGQMPVAQGHQLGSTAGTLHPNNARTVSRKRNNREE
jgi:hypothetical protein